MVHRDSSELRKYVALTFDVDLKGQNVIYRGEQILGAGGSSVVVRGANCTQPKLALKVLDANAVDNENSMNRFRYEGDLQQRLQNNNIVPLVGRGTTQLWNGKEAPVLAMPIYPATAEQLVNDSDIALPVDTTLKISIGALNGLTYLHGSGYLHRDVKPGNLFLDDSGRALLGDLGTCADISTGRGLCDPPGDSFIIGTPNYIAPESIRSEAYSPQADIYSMGATMFRMLSNLDVYGAPGAPLSSIAIMREKLKPSRNFEKSLRKIGFSNIPEDLDSLIISMLEDDPRNRPQSVQEVLDAAMAIYCDYCDL